ncbi:MAG: glycine dehydrogenase subunit 1 [Candidatus Omnitrophota bacterium]|jgi:glycine dehydrogenase subunit 1
MQYVANTTQDKKDMLQTIGVESFEDLLVDVPKELRTKGIDLPQGISEMELLSLLKQQGQKNFHSDRFACFLGAGVYDHYIPPLVNHLATRGEFITAYTPYQGEASQGTLQTIYEYQSMICMLTGMEASNASMYDGASAVAEAVVLALRAKPGRTQVIVSDLLHPEYLETVKTYIDNLDSEIVVTQSKNGQLDSKALEAAINDKSACVVLQNPNFFGFVENAQNISDITHAAGALMIACVNPMTLGVLTPPGEYGADIAVGEGQPLGNAMAYGGPHFGFFAVSKALMRRLPGRIAGLTKDKDGRRAFVLTLQAREQHIRREKATSNICTNHALCALKALIFLSALGPHGFKRYSELNLERGHEAAKALGQLDGVEILHGDHKTPFFNEFVIRVEKDSKALEAAFTKNKIIGPLHLKRFNADWQNHYLVAVTEQRSTGEIQRLAKSIQEA